MELNIIRLYKLKEVGPMSEENTKKPNSYPFLFVLLALGIMTATVLLAIGGIYFSFINPSF